MFKSFLTYATIFYCTFLQAGITGSLKGKIIDKETGMNIPEVIELTYLRKDRFLNQTKLLDSPKIQLEEVGNPLSFKWDKCKLETISYLSLIHI